MNKLFTLIISYGTGEIAMITKEPDLLKAVKEFESKLSETFGGDKGNMMPHIISAKILPVMYESVYKED